MARNVYQYEQPRCPDGWNESERRFYARLIQVLDDIYAKYGRIDEKMLSGSVVKKIENAPQAALDQITSEFGSATLDSLLVRELTAQTAYIVSLTVEKMVADTIVANQITAGTMEATFAYMVSLSAKFASFDFETVKNLVSDAMVLEKGSADALYIKNLSVLYAQVLNATLGSLCIKASDGNYYQIDVTEDENGVPKISAERVEVSDGEIAIGQTGGGKVILGTNILAENLSTGTLLATEALVNSILAAKIDVKELTARDAFIQSLVSNEIFTDRLSTSLIQSGFGSRLTIEGESGVDVLVVDEVKNLRSRLEVNSNSITLIAGEVADSKKAAVVFRQETFPDGGTAVRPNDLLIIPSSGQTYQAVDMSGLNLKFYVDGDGNLLYSLDGSADVYGFEFLNHELYAEGLAFTLNEDGSWETPYAWVRVQDKEMLNAIDNLVDTVDGKTTTWYQDKPPEEPAERDIWYDTNDGKIYRYTDGNWIDITTVALRAALKAAEDAQSTADGKIVTFAQDSAPVATEDSHLAVGDLWIDTNGDNMLYRWSGSVWVPYRDKMIESAQAAAEFATVYDSETPPSTAPETGKLWLDRSLVPPLLRRWLGTGTDTSSMDNWEVVNDTATIEAVQAEIAAKQAALEAEQRNMATFLKLDFDKVRIGKEGVTSEVQIDPWGMGVAVKSKVFSRFEADRVRFGNMEMRRPAAGGLMLDAIDATEASGVSM